MLYFLFFLLWKSTCHDTTNLTMWYIVLIIFIYFVAISKTPRWVFSQNPSGDNDNNNGENASDLVCTLNVEVIGLTNVLDACVWEREIQFEFYFLSQNNQVFLFFVCVFVVIFQQFAQKLRELKMCKLWWDHQEFLRN